MPIVWKSLKFAVDYTVKLLMNQYVWINIYDVISSKAEYMLCVLQQITSFMYFFNSQDDCQAPC